MSLQLDTMTAADLRAATLADIAEAVLARDPAGFRRDLGNVDPADIQGTLRELGALLGWTPPALLEPWLAIEAALRLDDSDACWTAGDRSLALDLPGGLPDDADRGEFLAGYGEAILCGLVQLSEGASGDRALASILPRAERVPVHAFRHERGDLRAARSLKAFLLRAGLSENDPEPGESPGWVGTSGFVRLQRELDAHDAGMEVEMESAAL